MKLSEIEDKIVKNYYNNIDPFPKKNQEEKRKWGEKQRGLERLFKRDVISFFLDYKCSIAMAERLEKICWEEGHPAGLWEVLHYVENLKFVAEEIKRLNEKIDELEGCKK